MAKKKYRIIQSFYYRGHDGKSKKSVVVSPGEELPKLNSDEMERLLYTERVCEVSSEDGSNIKFAKLRELNDDQIEGLVKAGPSRVLTDIKALRYSSETLAKLYREEEKAKFPQAALDIIEKKISE